LLLVPPPVVTVGFISFRGEEMAIVNAWESLFTVIGAPVL
jgi:hypothetical protein